MREKKENIIFNANNLLLSAFKDNEELSKLLKAENDLLLPQVNNELISDYKSILNDNHSNYLNKYMNKRFDSAFSKQTSLFNILLKSLKSNPQDMTIIKNISRVLNSLNAPDKTIKFFESQLLESESEDRELTQILADAYFGVEDYYSKSIKMYEKLINKYKIKNAETYYKLAFLYERVYQDKEIDKQIEYALSASKLSPNNNNINIFLAKLYYRKGLRGDCEKYSQKVLNNNPTAEQRVSYCRFLMQDGKITESYDIYRCRFKTDNVAYPDLLTDKNRWDGRSNLSNAIVIIHYEQGFGDSIMFVRYVAEIAKLAKKVILVIQKNIIPILKSSGFDKYCEILSHEADINPNIKLEDVNNSIMYSEGSGMGKIAHDYHIPMIDLPYLIKESPERMKEARGYLSADKDKVEEFSKKYIKDRSKIKIGIAYRGSKDSKSTYRDISIKEFLPLLDIDEVELYLFQADLRAEELSNIDMSRIIDVKDYFHDFGDTAAAISAMDLIISTDNVVLNLAGALAVKTYGLFNIYPESRWYKTTGEDVGWYKSVKPFKVDTYNNWGDLMIRVQKQIKKDFRV